MSKRKIEAEERIAISKKYLRGEKSYQKIAEEYGINKKTVEEIVAAYQAEGEERFTRTKNKKYMVCHLRCRNPSMTSIPAIMVSR